MYTWPLFIVKRFKEKPVVDTLLSSCVRIRTSDNLAFERSVDCVAVCTHNIVSVVDPRPTKKQTHDTYHFIQNIKWLVRVRKVNRTVKPQNNRIHAHHVFAKRDFRYHSVASHRCQCLHEKNPKVRDVIVVGVNQWSRDLTFVSADLRSTDYR